MNKTSNRAFVTFGIFSPRHWPLFAPHQGIERAYYEALKRAGFRETIWQNVYEGQLGSLVLLLEDGVTELHVRFFSDGSMEAELEVARHYWGHFTHPQHPAELKVLEILTAHLSAPELAALRHKFKSANLEAPSISNFAFRPGIPLVTLSIGIFLTLAVLTYFDFVPKSITFAFAGVTFFLERTLPAALV